MKRLLGVLVLAVAAALFNAAPAVADIVTYHYAADQQSYIADSNGIVTVNLYLVETLNGGSYSIASDGGLASYAIAINRQNGQTGASIQSASPNNTLFQPGNLPYANIVTPQYAQFGNIDNNASPKNVIPVGGKILLGTLQVLAMEGTTTRFNLGPLFPGTGETTYTHGFNDLDYSLSPSAYLGTADASNPFFGMQYFEVTAAAVPEPSSIVLAGAMCLFGAVRLRSRRKQAVTEVTA